MYVYGGLGLIVTVLVIVLLLRLLGVITAFVGRHQDLSLDPGTGF